MHRFRSWILDPPEYRSQRNRLLPIEGGDGSTLNLDFTTGVLDPRLSFSRTNNATFINSSGYVEWAAANNFTNSTFSGASGTTVPNWSFSVPTGSATVSLSGTALTITCTTATRARVVQSIGTGTGLLVTTQVKVTARSMAFPLNEVLAYSVNGSSQDQYKVNGVDRASNYTGWNVGDVISLTCIPANGLAAQAVIGIGASAAQPAGQSITITDVQAEPGTVVRTVIPTGTSGSYQAPRFDYDPTTGLPKGLLIEAGANNLLSYSENFAENTAGNWTGQAEINTTGTPAWTGFTAPDQQTTAHKIIPNTNNAQHYLEHAATSILSGTTYTVSLFVKPDGYNFVGLAMTGSQARATYQLVAPYTMTTYVGSEVPTITPYQNGWFRITLRWTASTTSSALRIYMQNAQQDPVTIFAGNNTGGIQAWGAQLEANSAASSYIPTGASTGNRTAESLSLSPSTWYSPAYAEGTFYFRGSILNTATGYTRLFALTASSSVGTATGTVANFNIGVAASNSNRPFLNTFNTSNNDVDIYVPVGAAVSNNVEFGVTAAYKSGDWRISSKNLAATSTYATVSYATWGNNLFLSNVNGISMPAVWYKQFKFYPIRLPNSQMDILSA